MTQQCFLQRNVKSVRTEKHWYVYKRIVKWWFTKKLSTVRFHEKMNRLIEIGFRKVGEWKILNESILPNLLDLANSSNILYAFISDGEALYVGKTTQILQKRLYGYQKPGSTQFTNIKGNKLLKELLVEGKPVDIYALPDNGLHHFGVFHLNLAAGLEDSIITTLKPKWNGSLK